MIHLKTQQNTAAQLTAAQLSAVRQAAGRPSRSLDPLPANIKGAARQSVLDALVALGYATKCFFPSHVEYYLTDLGLALGRQECAPRSNH